MPLSAGCQQLSCRFWIVCSSFWLQLAFSANGSAHDWHKQGVCSEGGGKLSHRIQVFAQNNWLMNITTHQAWVHHTLKYVEFVPTYPLLSRTQTWTYHRLEIKTTKKNNFHCRDYYDSKQADQGFITFDLQADLAPLFNWNVKVGRLLLHFLKILLWPKISTSSRFCSCTSVLSTRPHQLHTIQRWLSCVTRNDYLVSGWYFNLVPGWYFECLVQVLWDKIIMRGEKTKLDLKSIKTKWDLLFEGRINFDIFPGITSEMSRKHFPGRL